MRISLVALAACQVAAGGCAAIHKSHNPDLRPAHGLYIDLASRTGRSHTRMVYRQWPEDASDQEADEYTVIVGEDRREEGRLTGVAELPLEDYLPSGQDANSPAKFPWPRQEGQPTVALMVTFDPPLMDRPRSIAGDETRQYTSTFQCYNYKGRRIARGTVDRSFRVDGFEDVVIGDTTYTDCVVLNVETLFDVPWRARVRAIENLWLAPEVGVVRKTLSLRGFALLRLLNGDWHYELLRIESGGSARRPVLPSGWRRGVIMLSPVFTQARIAGLIVDTESIAGSVGRESDG